MLQGWTLESIYEHFTREMDTLSASLDRRLSACALMHQNISTKEAQCANKFDELMESRFTALSEKVDTINTLLLKIQGANDGKAALVGWSLTAAGALCGAINVAFLLIRSKP